MAEARRIKLTDFQFKQLLESQRALALADNNAKLIAAMVFDAHEVPQGSRAEIDDTTGELVVAAQ